MVSVPYSSGLGLSGVRQPPSPRPPSRFQSPIHRGLGCRGLAVPGIPGGPLRFQSPIHRGLGCRGPRPGRPAVSGKGFQSPIHRGLGCRGETDCQLALLEAGFSPLFIGAWVVGAGRRCQSCGEVDVSVPYSSGLGLSGKARRARRRLANRFQSPIHRGLGCRATHPFLTRNLSKGFSPLFIGAWVVGEPGLFGEGGEP